MTTEVNTPIPRLPLPPFQPIVGASYPNGARIINYLLNVKTAPLPEKFKENCELLDNLREQLRTSTNNSEILQLYIDYVTLLTKLTEGFDLNDTRLDLAFTWGKQRLNIIDFDICCLSFNLAVGFLNTAIRFDLNSSGSIKPALDCINSAIFLDDRARNTHHVDFESTITSNMIFNLHKHCELDITIWQAAASLDKTHKKLVSSKTLKLASNLAQKTNPPLTSLSKYTETLASFFYAQDLAENQEFGRAISILRFIESQFPVDKVMKKLPKNEQEDVNIFKKAVSIVLPRISNLNEQINFKIIPDKPENIPELPLKPIPIIIKVEPTVKPLSYSEVICSAITANISKGEQINNNCIASLSGVDEVINLIPNGEINQAQDILTDFYAKRTLTNSLAEQISGILGRNNSIISSKMPEAFEQFGKMRNIINQASQKDLFYETKFGKAKSILEPITVLKGKLDYLKVEITKKQGETNTRTQEFIKQAQETNDPAKLMQIQTNSQNYYMQAEGVLSNLFLQIEDLKKNMKTQIDLQVPPYLAEIKEIKAGFLNGLECYTRLSSNLENLVNSIQSL